MTLVLIYEVTDNETIIDIDININNIKYGMTMLYVKAPYIYRSIVMYVL